MTIWAITVWAITIWAMAIYAIDIAREALQVVEAYTQPCAQECACMRVSVNTGHNYMDHTI